MAEGEKEGDARPEMQDILMTIEDHDAMCRIGKFFADSRSWVAGNATVCAHMMLIANIEPCAPALTIGATA